jgi:pimeloyl-ACP methyl ester carboxylesterase
MTTISGVRNVVLVHGAFVDGSGWRAVYDLLVADGYRVAVVQNPTLSLAGDVAATRQVIDSLDGPVVLVGHSYGGAVITEVGTHLRVPTPGSDLDQHRSVIAGALAFPLFADDLGVHHPRRERR